MDWFSQPDLTGSADVRDPAMETVQSTDALTQTDILVREALQNSMDAAFDDNTVLVRFRISFFKDDHLARFLEQIEWPALKEHVQAHRDQLAKRKRPQRILDPVNVGGDIPFPVLFIEDHNTRGLRGAEFDPGDDEALAALGPHSFVGLCRNFGDNQKAAGSIGGTHGFGKTVYWKSSSIFTVLFSSVLADPWEQLEETVFRRFIGVSKLKARYVGGELYNNPLVFRSGVDDKGRPLSAWNEEAMRYEEWLGFSSRTDDSIGTTIAILGATDPDGESVELVDLDSAKQLIRNILAAAEKWFWPAIADQKLIIEGYVDDELVGKLDEVTDTELLPFLDVYRSTQTDGVEVTVKVPKQEIQPQMNGVIRLGFRKIQKLDRVSEKLRNRVALIRGPRMVIGYQHFQRKGLSASDYVGVALAGTMIDRSDPNQKAVELLLARSEPVTHDRWSHNAELLKGWYGAGAAVRRLLEDIKKLVQEETDGETTDSSLAAPELARLLSLGVSAGGESGHTVSINRVSQLERTDNPDGTSCYMVTYRLSVPSLGDTKWSKHGAKSQSVRAIKAIGGIGFLSLSSGSEQRINIPLHSAEVQEGTNEIPVTLDAEAGKAVFSIPVTRTKRLVDFRLKTVEIPTSQASSLKFQDECKVLVGFGEQVVEVRN